MNGAWLKRTGAAATIGLIIALLRLNPSQADEAFPMPRTTFGSIGLIEMPSARMAPDGELSLSTSFSKNLQRYNLGFQALPWMEFSFRYSILHGLPIDPSNSQYYDRSFGLGLRLFKEGEYRPAIVLGIRDLVGTGIYSAEYLAATKRVFDDFDVTIGLGWGRLSTADSIPNPLGYISPSFKTRPGFGLAGSFNPQVFFHGPHVGIFGGLVWRTPLPNLSLTAEYSSDAYNLESQYGGFHAATQFNFGAQYQVSDSLQVGAEWLYGQSFGLTLTFSGDPTKPAFTSTLAPNPIQPSIRTPEQQLQALKELMQPLRAQQRVREANAVRTPPDVSNFVTTVYHDRRIKSLSLRGRTLILFIAGPATQRTCMDLAEGYAEKLTDIGELDLHATNGKHIRCAAPTSAHHDEHEAIDVRIATVPITSEADTPLELPSGQDKSANSSIRQDAVRQLVFIDSLGFQNGVATVYYENGTYQSAAEAAGRLIRVLMKDAPPNVEEFHLISMVDGLPAQEYDVLRAPMERAVEQHGGAAAISGAVSLRLPPMHPPFLEDADSQPYPRFTWSLLPSLRESFFNPQNPFRMGVFAELGAEFRLTPRFAVSGSLEANIWNNLVSGRYDNSVLPHVRSDFEQYYKKGADGISSLMLSYRWRIAPDITALVKGGYLESMFGGFGGEVLWHPERSRFAVGVDLYQVWQRNFDRLFGFQKYNVLTGHVSLYYKSPWHHVDFHFLYGRYLAGDHGFTFEISRRFSTGVEIGAFATITNVSAAQFGEGSFDKGIIIRIPFDWLLPIPTQNEYSLDLRPLTRDGGQRLAGDTVLYDVLQRESYGTITRHWQELETP